MQPLHGNLTGLSASDKQLLERIYRRRVAPSEVVSEELGAFLGQVSTTVKRQVGVLIDRAGLVTHVIVGDPRTGSARSAASVRSVFARGIGASLGSSA